jgi:hypothetical protein
VSPQVGHHREGMIHGSLPIYVKAAEATVETGFSTRG